MRAADHRSSVAAPRTRKAPISVPAEENQLKTASTLNTFGEPKNGISGKNLICQWFVIGGLAILSDNKGGTLELAFLKIVC